MLADKFSAFFADYELIQELYGNCRQKLFDMRADYTQYLRESQKIEEADHEEASQLVIKVQNDLNKVRTGYEMLRLEFEQTMTSQQHPGEWARARSYHHAVDG